MTPQLILLLLPGLVAVVALLLKRRSSASAILGLVTVLVLWLVVWLVSPASVAAVPNAQFLGLSLTVGRLARDALLLVYPLVGLLFLTALFWPSGRLLVSTILGMLVPVTAALATLPTGTGGVWLLLALGLLLPYLYSGNFDAVSPAWRYFSLGTLAIPGLILAHWFTLSGAVNDTLLVGCLLSAMLILCAGFPFHIWVGGLVRHAPVYGPILALGLVQLAAVTLIFTLLDSAPGARASATFQTALRLSAASTGLLAAFRMTRAADWRELVAYAVLLDAGLLLVLFLVPGPAGLGQAWAAITARWLGLLIIAVGFVAGSADNVINVGLSRIRGSTLARALLVYGSLSLVGMPLTPGFPVRWLEIQTLAVTGRDPLSLVTAALVFAALAAAAYACLSKAALLTTPVSYHDVPRRRAGTVYMLILFALVAFLGLAGPILAPRIMDLAG